MTTWADTNWNDLSRYLTGEATADERAAIERWFDEDPARHAAFDDLRRGWQSVDPSHGVWDGEEMWTRVYGRLELGHRDDGIHARDAVFPSDTRGDRPIAWRRFGRAVRHKGLGLQTLRNSAWFTLGGFLLGTIVVLAGWKIRERFTQGRAFTMTTYTTANGQRANVTLGDGSTVALNVGSRLDVPTNFMAGNHTVRLVGEGLFTVSHHDGTPLVVLAGPTTTRVLGTRFVVRRYPTDTTTIVAVQDGKVSAGSAVVTANQLAEIRGDDVTRMGPAGPSQFSFARGVLALHDMSLRAAIPELNRWYNADIRVDDSTLAAQQIGGRFIAGSVMDLANILELILDVHVVRDGRQLTLYSRPPQ